MSAEALMVAVRVGTPLSLLGLACALAYMAYARRLKFQEKKLEALPPEERAARTDEYLTRYGIDGKKLRAADKLGLIKDELDKRHRRSMAFGITAAVVFVVCFALCVVAFVVNSDGSGGPAPSQPSTTRLDGPAWADLSQAASFLRQQSRAIPSMQKSVGVFSELSQHSAGQFFCSKSLLANWTDPTLKLKGIPKDAPAPTVAVYVFVPPGNDAEDQDARTTDVQAGVATLKLKGRVPVGSVVLVACWVADAESTALDTAQFEAFLE